jgi:hypothetical protein
MDRQDGKPTVASIRLSTTPWRQISRKRTSIAKGPSGYGNPLGSGRGLIAVEADAHPRIKIGYMGSLSGAMVSTSHQYDHAVKIKTGRSAMLKMT